MFLKLLGVFVLPITNIGSLQPILAKKIYDICKFQLLKKNKISRKVLKTRRLYLDCIRHFQARPHKAKFFEEN